MGEACEDEDSVLPRLRAAQSNLASLLRSAADADCGLADTGDGILRGLEAADFAAEAVAPLHSQGITNKALHARINRAVSPALAVLQSFSLVESLQHRLLRLSSARPSDNHSPRVRLSRLLKYVDTVDRLHAAISAVTDGCDPAVQRLQEAVEFLSRTKAADQQRTHRLQETLAALKALYETEVDAISYEGLLDEALLRLQDELESLLHRIQHRRITAEDDDDDDDDNDDEIAVGDSDAQLGSEFEIEVLQRIAQSLTSNDCLDICIDIYVKVRYRRAAKALMRLKSDHLKMYEPEEIDGMDWEALETAICRWIEHFELVVREVLAAEKRLCEGVLGGVMDGAVWPECFTKIADKIMAVFFRFGEGVARSSKEPQKLFKLLDMFDAMERLRPHFVQVFDGEPGIDICTRFRELQKLLVHASSKVFWEFELQIESDAAPPPSDGTVPKMVRYAVNYLKCLVAGGYAAAMGRVLQTEQVWKAGFLSTPEPNETLLRDAVTGVLDAVQRNVEAKRGRYKDRAAAHVFAMNAHWYMYMRTRGSELAALVGEEGMRRRYKAAAEEAAYAYQAQAWGPLVRLVDIEEGDGPPSVATSAEREGVGAVARVKIEAFLKGFDENLRRHRGGYSIPDLDLRDQIRGAVADLVVPAYDGFLRVYWPVMQGRSFPSPDSMQRALGKLFDRGGGEGGRRSVEGGGESGRRMGEGGRSVDGGESSLEQGGEGGRMSSADSNRGGSGRRSMDERSDGGDGGRRSADGKSSGSGGGSEGWRVLVEGKPTVQKSGRVSRWRNRGDSGGPGY